MPSLFVYIQCTKIFFSPEIRKIKAYPQAGTLGGQDLGWGLHPRITPSGSSLGEQEVSWALWKTRT